MLDRMSIQITVRLTPHEVQELDKGVAAGDFSSRTHGIRTALALLTATQRQRRIDAAIVEGYRRIPPTSAELSWAAASGRELIAEEPW